VGGGDKSLVVSRMGLVLAGFASSMAVILGQTSGSRDRNPEMGPSQHNDANGPRG
jgi:hypothetical protein